jgi:hypothetical protein
VFTDYIQKIYDIKSNPKNPTQKNLAKLLLNSIIGRFGMDYLKNITKLVDAKTHNHINVTRRMGNSIEIDENTFLDSFKPGIDKEVCNEFDVDYVKALNLEGALSDEKSAGTYNAVSISTAAAILSYASVHMLKLKLYILSQGGIIYYTDTDSIVTNIILPPEFVDPKEIGKLKLEHTIVEGYFLADKTYAMKTQEGEIIKRAKGIDARKLSFDDYRKMYSNESIDNTVRTSSIRNYVLGSVNIEKDKRVQLNMTDYHKRVKVLDDKGM